MKTFCTLQFLKIQLKSVVSRHGKKLLNKATLWTEVQFIKSRTAELPRTLEDTIQQQEFKLACNGARPEEIPSEESGLLTIWSVH